MDGDSHRAPQATGHHDQTEPEGKVTERESGDVFNAEAILRALSQSDAHDPENDADDVMTEATAPEIENALRAAISAISVDAGGDSDEAAAMEMQDPTALADDIGPEEASEASPAPEMNAEAEPETEFVGFFADTHDEEHTAAASVPETAVSTDAMDDDVPLFDDDDPDELMAGGADELDTANPEESEPEAAEDDGEDALAAFTATLFAADDDDRDEVESPDEPEEGLHPAQEMVAAEDPSSDGFAPAVGENGQDFVGADSVTNPVESGSDTPEDHENDETSEEVFVAGSAAMAAQAAPQMFPTIDESDTPGRKPRIALMGEFSAGKSTLSNLLIGASPLPTRVTATQLPPVWISWGDGQAYREDLDGETHPIDVERIGEIDPSETRVIRLFCQSDILELCDIIDMPGISDPNMASDVWERVIGKADGVLWCTHATQAWRQSEAAVWESLDDALFKKSLLLITRFDKLRNDVDRARVLKRVERETRDLFAERLPISLTEALSAGEDAEKWTASGAEAFTDRLVALLHDLSTSLGTSVGDPLARSLSDQEDTVAGRPRSVQVRRQRSEPVAPRRVVPRRVRPASDGGARNAAF